MLGVAATGVGSHADMLFATLAAAGRPPLVLREQPGRAPGRLARLARAALPGRRRLAPGPGALLAGPGLFREAQVHLDLYGRPLVLEADGPPGIMHWTYPLPLMLAGWRNVYTVHDLIPLARPDLTPISPRRHRRLLDAILPHADRLLAVSEAGRDEIVRLLGWPEAQVGNCWQAADPRPGNQSLFAPGGYHLFCGTIEPRKNLARLAQAHARAGIARPLVLAGPTGDAALAARLAAMPGVVRLPWQDRATLHALIRDARAMLFPSLAEGFGLPIVEAMMLGTPVMTSEPGATAEVAGGAALLVDPLDCDAIANAIRRLDGDDALRADLAARGRTRARFFTPAAYAARLAAFHAEVAA
ncbi:glycosyltransferase family 4 protein [Sphingomonas quercus]|nr:glycosyltransferase family 1 protein [Sphingomonas quercus]